MDIADYDPIILFSGSSDARYPSPKREDSEPSMKKRKESDKRSSLFKLERRLIGIFYCAVCLDLPEAAIYQCVNGHLMCAGCFTHLLADARLRDETPLCPNCRTLISKDLCCRNLAAEKAVSELPASCKYCSEEVPRGQLEAHQAIMCEDRLSECRYSRIGCKWNGPYHERKNHEAVCNYPLKCGADVMEAVEAMDRKKKEEMMLSSRIYELLSLSFENISFNDLQFKPYRTDEYIHKLYYETLRFVAFNHQWVVKATVNDDQRDPTQSCERSLSYQLILKSKICNPVKLTYFILKGPFGDMKILPQVHQHEFTEGDSESSYQVLPLCDSAECNKLLSAKVINFRLILFHGNK